MVCNRRALGSRLGAHRIGLGRMVGPCHGWTYQVLMLWYRLQCGSLYGFLHFGNSSLGQVPYGAYVSVPFDSWLWDVNRRPVQDI